MSELAGYKGGRLHRPVPLERILGKFKSEIINFAADQWTEYSTEWLASQVVEIWWEDLPKNVSVKEVEQIVARWDKEIRDLIDESFEPSPREEALKEIQQETLRGL